MRKEKKKAEIVASRLRKSIINGHIQRNQRLYEDKIAHQYEVSRSPVREALRLLSEEGYVKIVPRRGAVVSALSPTQVKELYEVRSALEAIVGSYAVENISSEDLDKLQEIADQMNASADDITKFRKLNRGFHTIIHRASQKRYIVDIATNLQKAVEFYFAPVLLNPKEVKRTQSQHFRIIEALKQRDREKVEALMRQHMLDAGKAALDFYYKTPPSQK